MHTRTRRPLHPPARHLARHRSPRSRSCSPRAAAARRAVLDAERLERRASATVTLRLGYFPNVTHAPAIIGVAERLVRGQARPERQARAQDVQLRHRGDHRAARRRDRRVVRRPEPGDQRLPEDERRHPHRRRHRVGRRRPRREAEHQQRGRPQGQEDRDAAARQHAGRRAAHVAEQERPARDQGRRRRHDRPRGQLDARSPRSSRAPSTARGCPSRARRRLVTEGGGKILVNEATLWPERQVRDDAARW